MHDFRDTLITTSTCHVEQIRSHPVFLQASFGKATSRNSCVFDSSFALPIVKGAVSGATLEEIWYTSIL